MDFNEWSQMVGWVEKVTKDVLGASKGKQSQTCKEAESLNGSMKRKTLFKKVPKDMKLRGPIKEPVGKKWS